ncbi:MAG: nitroreductase family protein [Conexivisphaerales archaeon]
MAKLENLPRPAPEEEKLKWVYVEAGHKAQNVYIYCASEGINTVVRALIDKETFSKAIGLNPKQIIVLAQTIGYRLIRKE